METAVSIEEQDLMSGKKRNLITDKKLGYVKPMCKHDFRSRGTRGKN